MTGEIGRAAVKKTKKIYKKILRSVAEQLEGEA